MDWWNPFSAECAELRTQLSPEECVERLKPLLLPWHRRLVVGVFAGPVGAHIQLAKPDDLAGVASRDGFQVRLAMAERARGGRNTLQTEATGRFIPSPDGTRIPIRFGLIRSVAVTLWPLIGVVTIVSGLGLGFVAFDLGGGIASILLLSISMMVLMLSLSLGLVWWLRHLTRDEASSLLRLLCAALDAEEVPPAGRAGADGRPRPARHGLA